mgnify:CR=1 FL=1
MNMKNLSLKPQGIKAEHCPDYLLKAACKAWDEAVELGEKYGYRNAQATVIAPNWYHRFGNGLRYHWR